MGGIRLEVEPIKKNIIKKYINFFYCDNYKTVTPQKKDSTFILARGDGDLQPAVPVGGLADLMGLPSNITSLS